MRLSYLHWTVPETYSTAVPSVEGVPDLRVHTWADGTILGNMKCWLPHSGHSCQPQLPPNDSLAHLACTSLHSNAANTQIINA